MEPFYDKNLIGGWICNFTESIKKMKEREEYDRVWELIKKKNNW